MRSIESDDPALRQEHEPTQMGHVEGDHHGIKRWLHFAHSVQTVTGLNNKPVRASHL